MNLPNADAAEIAPEKMRDYLLNPRHPDGAGKAAFFMALGFDADEPAVFAKALLTLCIQFPVTSVTKSSHGTKYVIDGALISPTGRMAMVRTVWIVDSGLTIPRLVTAFPA